MRLAVVACLALAAVTLLGPHQPTYDPWAWLSWGREITHGQLDTVGGPSWKPFPVLFTTPFSLLGADAPQLWLVIARAGLLLAFVAAFRLAASVAGPVAGAVAVVGIALIDRFVALTARGTSEGLLAAFALGAVDRPSAGHRGQALTLGCAAGLVRPEVWPYLGLYALWLAWSRPERRDRLRALALIGAGGVVLLVAWFVPEKLGSGSVLRGASRALEAVGGSPAQAAHPFLAVFGNSAGAVAPPLYAGALLAVVLAVRTRERVTLLLAAASASYMIIVAVLAQVGFTGNERYVLLPASVVCVLGGIGLVQSAGVLASRVGQRWAVAIVGIAGLAFAVSPVQRLARQINDTQRESDLYDHLGAAVRRAGGRAAIERCGKVYTDPYQTQAVLWELHLRGAALGIHPIPPGTILAPASTPAGRDARFTPLLRHGGWVVRSTCR
jgi:hypothetical protein